MLFGNILGAPRFTTVPQNVLVAPGDAETTLLCQALGVPKPSIKWAKNGVQLPPSYKYDHRPDGSLTIRDIDPSDHGNYQCEATNVNGRITADANVIIKCTYKFFNLAKQIIKTNICLFSSSHFHNPT